MTSSFAFGLIVSVVANIAILMFMIRMAKSEDLVPPGDGKQVANADAEATSAA